jgi:glucokinase
MSEQAIGVDVGGTAIKLGRYTREGDCLESLKIATPQPAAPDAVIEAIATAIRQLDPDKRDRAWSGNAGTSGYNGPYCQVSD